MRFQEFAVAPVACPTTSSQSNDQFSAADGSVNVNVLIVCAEVQDEFVPPVPQDQSDVMICFVCEVVCSNSVTAAFVPLSEYADAIGADPAPFITGIELAAIRAELAIAVVPLE